MTSDGDDLERRALDLVEAALDKPPDERRGFLMAWTEDSPDLQARVLAILDADGGRAPLLPTGGARDHAPDAPVPDSIGGYRIERQIGRGGMGAVYLGRRITADFDHVAAIKVVQAGAASPGLIERLRVERRTLARLKHPNIAQMYDGGEMTDGAPFFVMEYVAGAPLDRFVSANTVSLDGRLGLFLDVCDAVSFAHRNLVVHRDLSPANMLVSDAGHVKLIDFGIAHSLREDGPATETAVSRSAMTKGYAAPERLDGAPASTITDVYSLGVVLEEMIGGLDAPRRADLTAIAAKARAASPDARYRSVDALVRDIVAYRRGQTVTAMEGGWTYVLARFVGRRKLAVAAGATALAATIATSIVMSVLYIRADVAERRAVQRFDQVRELAGFILFDFHDEVAKLEGSTPAREMLTKTALDYLDGLSATPGASDALKLELALGYKRLSDVTGNAGFANLGRRQEADTLLNKAAAQVADLKRTTAHDPAVLSAFVEIIFAQAIQEGFANNGFERGYALLGEGRTAVELLTARGTASLKDRLNEAHIAIMQGYYLQRLEQSDKPVARIAEGLGKYEALAAEYPDDANVRLGLARANVTLAEAMAWHIYYTEGDYETTLPFFDKGVAETRKLLLDPEPTMEMKMHLIVSLLKRANTTCYTPNREREGLADLAEAAAFTEGLAASDPTNDRLFEHLTHIVIQQSHCYQNLGLLAEAARAGKIAVDRRHAQLQANPGNPGLLANLANSLSILASLHMEAGDWANACDSAKRLEQTWRRYDEHQSTSSVHNRDEQQSNRDLLAQCAERGVLQD